MENPLAHAFMVDAFLLLGLLSYLLARWGVARLGPGWFVGLSILGSIVFPCPRCFSGGESDVRGAIPRPELGGFPGRLWPAMTWT